MMTKNIQKILIALLLLVAGGTEVWGQKVPDGVYYIKHDNTWYLWPSVTKSTATGNNFVTTFNGTEAPATTIYSAHDNTYCHWVVKNIDGGKIQLINPKLNKWIVIRKFPKTPNDSGKSGVYGDRDIWLTDKPETVDSLEYSYFILNNDNSPYKISPNPGVNGIATTTGYTFNSASNDQANIAAGSGTTGRLDEVRQGLIQLYSGGTPTWEFTTDKLPAPTINYDSTCGYYTFSYDKIAEGFNILYTTNGNDPTIGGEGVMTYDGSEVTVTANCTVKAVVARYGIVLTNVASQEVEELQVPTAPVISSSGDCSNEINISSGGCTTVYYTTDGSTPSDTHGTIYSTPIVLNNNATIKAIAYNAAGASPVTTYNYEAHTPKPVITQSGNVISISGEGTIYYTLDGTDPEVGESSIYSSPIVREEGSGDVTVKAIAKSASKLASCVTEYTASIGYFIYNISDFDKLSEHPERAYILANDINASGYTENITLTGSFDGSFHTISNISRPLFTSINGGTVKNVILKNVSISGSGSVGAIAGVAEGYSRIYNCGILPSDNKYENESSSVSSSNGYCGGLVGWLKDDSRVINCFSYANITGGTTVAGIVGYNDFASTTEVTDGKYTKLKTAVVNCLFYGNITGGTPRYPVYGGAKILNNTATGINNYDFYRAEANLGLADNSHYNCSWPAQEEYLTKYEYYRYLLNSNRELCGWWVRSDVAPSTLTTTEVQAIPKDASLMAKWVLDPSIAPYPILKPAGKYFSAVNQDPDNRLNPDSKTWESRQTSENTITTKAAPDTEGQKLGSITVTINKGGSLSGSSSKNITITAMDIENNDFCYGKIQLPYYNSIFGDPNSNDWTTRYGGNYGDQVVVGWEITSVTGGTPGTLVENWQTGYDFADRDCTNKDKARIFAQGGYYYVPNGVSAISITAKWADATYLDNNDNYYDRISVSSVSGVISSSTFSPFEPAGKRSTTLGNGKTVQTGSILSNLQTGGVYDKAIVLVGNNQNFTGNNNYGGGSNGFTVMSADFDLDDEPDYSLIWQLGNQTSRYDICPIRFDFLPVVEMGMAMKEDGSTQYYSLGCYRPLGHFEVTETSLIHFGQFEFGNQNRSLEAPLILNGGIYDQFTKGTGVGGAVNDDINYIIIGGNVYMPSFTPGAHVNNNANYSTRHCAVNVLGGRINNLYLTGNFNNNVTPNTDNPHCYIDGGNFKQIAAAAKEGINGDVYFKINHSVIEEFYGGSTLADKLVTGNINVTVDNSKITKYCGGPKFGDMGSGKTVTTNATGTTFGVYYGGGNGGTSYVQYSSIDNMVNNATVNYNWGTSGGLNGYTPNSYRDGEGNHNYMADYEMEIVNTSAGTDTKKAVFRTYFYAAQFSATNTGPITNNLTNCKVLTNFYGGGNLGGVIGDATSTLTNTIVQGSAFGAGYSASVPEVTIHNKNKVAPTINVYTGNIISSPEGSGTGTTYTWTNETSLGGQTLSTSNPAVLNVGGKNYFFTEVPLVNLGAVTGNVTLTLDNSTVGSQADDTLNKGNVFGGGEQSSVNGNTTVTITGGNIYGSVFGGGDIGSVGTFTTNGDGKPTGCTTGGKCTVEIKGAANIGHDGMTMPDDWGHIFGAGRGTVNPEEAAKVGGEIDHVAYVDTTVVTIGVLDAAIETSPLVKGSVYGGSENGHVLRGTKVVINSGQIGVGKNTTARYTAEQWSGGSSLAPCASWTYEEDGYVYDPYTPEGGWDDKHKDLRPSSKIATDGHTYYGNVFGGGSGVIPYAAGEWRRASGIVEGSTQVEINGGHILTSVYGGNEQTDVLGVTSVEMNGGTVGVPRSKSDIEANPALCYVFGGGKGDKRTKFNTWTNVKSTSVAIKGGTVYGSVYGGGEDGHVLRDAAMAVTPAENKTVRIGCGGTSGYDGNVFGGGQGSPVAQTAGVISGNVSVNVTGGTMWGSVYGGGRLASVGTYLVPATETPSKDDKYGRLIPDGKEQVVTDDGSAADITVAGRTHGVITMTVTGGNIKGSVFGAGKGDRRTDFNTWTNVKSTSVTINGGTIEGSVFGGGEDGHVLRDVATLINPTESKTIVIGKAGAADSGNVFGAGKGSTTALTAGVVSGNVTLDIKGGTMWGSVYGGGRLAAVGTYLVPAPETPSETDKYGRLIPDGKEQIVVNNGPGFEEDAEGRTHGNITVSLTGGTIHGDVFGGGMGTQEEVAHADILGISKNVQLDLNDGVATRGVKGCVVKGNIFGCNNMNASPKGTVDVHIHATQNEAASQIANTAEVEDAKVDGRYDVKAVYGGGNMAAYVPEDLSNGKTNVTIDGCQLTSIQQVYGGGNAASTPATSVTVNGTYEIEEVFGGGNGKDDIIVDGVTKPNPGANVGFYDYSAVEDVYDTKEKRETEEFVSEYVYGTGAASVNIFGGTIHRVFGGSNTKGNVKNTAVTMLDENSDCAFCVDEAYGGGKSAPMDAEAKLLMACIPGLQAVYGGAEAADVHGDVTLNITNGTFKRVFGGNNISGTIDGAIKVNIEEVGCRPIIIGELYGGGNKAAYSIYGYNDNGTPKTSGENPKDDPQVNLKAFTSIGAVYGGGYGTTATMVGNPTVNINEVVGNPHTATNPDTYPTSGTDGSIGGTFDETGYSGATGVVVDTETGHTVDIPAHVKGEIGAIGKVFGGGNAAPVMGSTTVNVGNLSTVDFESTGEGEAEPRTGVTVIGADIKGNVYGGGDEAEVTGNANVNVGKRKVATP